MATDKLYAKQSAVFVLLNPATVRRRPSKGNPFALPAAPADPSTHSSVELSSVGALVVPSVGGQRNDSVAQIKGGTIS
jgi:hypothetical protein